MALGRSAHVVLLGGADSCAGVGEGAGGRSVLSSATTCREGIRAVSSSSVGNAFPFSFSAILCS